MTVMKLTTAPGQSPESPQSPPTLPSAMAAADTLSPDEESQRPLEPRIVLTLKSEPEHHEFTRYLRFTNHFGQQKRLAVAFRQAVGLPNQWLGLPALRQGAPEVVATPMPVLHYYESHDFPEGIDALWSLVDTGNRSYWDTMHLENLGGSTSLAIVRVLIEMPYDDPSGSSPRNLDHARIPIVDAAMDLTLASGDSSIALDTHARDSRQAWAGIDSDAPGLIKSVARDLGKSGSDGEGSDRFGPNPKYGAQIDNLCSEFVSWYYHESDVSIGNQPFRDIVGTQQLHELFSAEGKLYRYHSGHRQFEDPATGAAHQPKAGDFLERRGPDGAEHSMIMLEWDAAASEAIVFNGPWPVTLRRVDVQFDEVDGGKDFWLGCVVL